MYVIELYRKYFENSFKGLTEEQRANKLNFEYNKLMSILKGLDNMFYQDSSITDKKDHSIYTAIKRDIMSDAVDGDIESVVFTAKFLLEGIVNEIENMQVKAVVA